MKYTCPTPAPGDPKPPVFNLLALGVGVWGNTNFSVRVEDNANFSIFRYQHVGIPNTKLWQGPNAKGFAAQWNIGFRESQCELMLTQNRANTLLYSTAEAFLQGKG